MFFFLDGCSKVCGEKVNKGKIVKVGGWRGFAIDSGGGGEAEGLRQVGQTTNREMDLILLYWDSTASGSAGRRVGSDL